ncbi:MAG: nucleotidyltransferase family protein [Candidatus Omnitrophica bacterium]|nr:nucleotidyltransferase family protein [Candidatus Omnitrophota bacterium]
MTKLQKIGDVISKHKPVLYSKFKVKELAVFGSYVRGENKKTSDLDMLVEFSGPVGFLAFMELEEYLRHLLKVRKIDLVSKKALKPIMGRSILKEAVPLW